RGPTKGNGKGELGAAVKKPTHERWKVSDLKINPRQQEFFGSDSDVEQDALTEDVRRNGLEKPIQIMPDGTILVGHRRFEAVKRLGWAVVDVVVRWDLAEAGEAACEQFFINDNLLHRRLTGLGKARCVRHLLELAGSWGEELKERIAERMGISLRSANR